MPNDPADDGRRRRVRRAAVSGLAALIVMSIATLTLQRSSSPVGKPVPVTPGWRLTFSDEFDGSSIDTSKWLVYRGKPKGGIGHWDPALVQVSDGMLVLRSQRIGGEWVTSGVSSSRAGSQTYGKWEVRFRIDAGNGIGYALLLYPQSGGWPPEVDFAEDGGGTRQSTTATLHWSPGNQEEHATTVVDLTVWHVMGVVIHPGITTYTLDGEVWATMYGHTPAEPMWVGIQTQLKRCQAKYTGTCMTSTMPSHVDLDVDYVRRWAATRAAS